MRAKLENVERTHQEVHSIQKEHGSPKNSDASIAGKPLNHLKKSEDYDCPPQNAGETEMDNRKSIEQ